VPDNPTPMMLFATAELSFFAFDQGGPELAGESFIADAAAPFEWTDHGHHFEPLHYTGLTL
jgi:hypothetical protein